MKTIIAGSVSMLLLFLLGACGSDASRTLKIQLPQSLRENPVYWESFQKRMIRVELHWKGELSESFEVFSSFQEVSWGMRENLGQKVLVRLSIWDCTKAGAPRLFPVLSGMAQFKSEDRQVVLSPILVLPLDEYAPSEKVLPCGS